MGSSKVLLSVRERAMIPLIPQAIAVGIILAVMLVAAVTLWIVMVNWVGK